MSTSRREELLRRLASEEEEYRILKSHYENLRGQQPPATAEIIRYSYDIGQLEKRLRAIKQEIDELAAHNYRRSTGGIEGFVSGILPELPEEAPVVHSTKEALEELPSKWGLAILSLATAMIVGAVMYFVAPWSHFSLIGSGAEVAEYAGLPRMLGIIAFAILTFGIAIWSDLKTKQQTVIESSGLLMPGIIKHEHRYRLGAEQWGLGAQIVSSLVFGVSYLVIAFPVYFMVATSVLGFIFIRHYRSEYAKSGGNVHHALLSSAKLHRCVFVSFVGVITAALIVVIYGFAFSQ